MKYLKYIVLFLWFTPVLQGYAHAGEDHGDDTSQSAATGLTYFSSEAISDKYEVLIKYTTIKPGSPGTMRLFISEFVTNRPVDARRLKVTVSGYRDIALTAKRTDVGTYIVEGTFPLAQPYNIVVSFNGPLGADLIQVARIEIGKTLAVEQKTVTPWYARDWLLLLVGILVGCALMVLLVKRRIIRVTTINKKTVAGVMLLCLIPASPHVLVYAHEGHNEPQKTTGGTSNSFVIGKESQFLFGILTDRVTSGAFTEAIPLMGTVIASPLGQAVIQSPQAGKIVALRVRPGQAVTKGQTLALIEQQVDVGTQIDIISQRNNLEAEVRAAKAQDDRLRSIADIAAKKDITEARARYESAVRNLQLFQANAGRNLSNTKIITLTAPISGVVGTFNYAIGAVVNAGQTLFDITNVNSVYVETQVFSNQTIQLRNASMYRVVSPVDNVTEYALNLISSAQTVNANNQSQRVIFSIQNPDARFKIGQNVTVRLYTDDISPQIVVPSEAVIDIQGKSAVVIKDKAEVYSISFVNVLSANGTYTAITKGVEEGERVVVKNVYQVKMMYLSQ